MMGFGFGMGGIVMVIITIAVIGLGIVFLGALFPKAVSNNANGGNAQQMESLQSATEILKQRYSRGEITQEQFVQMRRDLEA